MNLCAAWNGFVNRCTMCAQAMMSLLEYDQAGSNQAMVKMICSGDSAHLGYDTTPVATFTAARRVLDAERRQVPLVTLMTLIALFSWLVATQQLAECVECAGVAYWALVLSVAPVTLGIMAVVRPCLLRKTQLKQEVRTAVVTCPACCTVSPPLLAGISAVLST
jgi:hypothetical protein